MRSFICSASRLDRDGRLDAGRAAGVVDGAWQYTHPCFNPCLHSCAVPEYNQPHDSRNKRSQRSRRHAPRASAVFRLESSSGRSKSPSASAPV